VRSGTNEDSRRRPRSPRPGVDGGETVPEATAGAGGTLKVVGRLGALLIGIQFIGLLVAGTVLYRHWDVTNDYALYSQAWYLIAHGHLDPYSTVIGRPFWKNHFELAMWVLAPLYWVTPATVGLKWIQSAAAAGAELVALSWVLGALRRHGPRAVPPAVLSGGFVVLLLTNAYFYSADWFDFHFQAIATLLLVAAGRDLYNGRHRRALVWSGLMLLTGDVAGTYLVGLGVAAFVASRATRRTGVVMVIAGAAWVGLVSALGANVGSDIVGGLGYLADSGHVTLLTVLAGTIRHPSRWARVLIQRWRPIIANLQGGGLVGVLAPWVLFPTLAILIPSALQANIGYITSPFQSLPVFILTPVGTVLVLDWLARRLHGRRPLVSLAVPAVVGLAALGSALAFSVPKLQPVKDNWFAVHPATFHQLDAVRASIPRDDEVIASSAISGGFGGRAQLIPWIGAPQVFPLAPGRQVTFVFVPDDPLQPIPAPMAVQAAQKVATLPGARVTTDAGGVVVVRWTPPRTAGGVTLPSGVVIPRSP
jgi:hypothetical protein